MRKQVVVGLIAIVLGLWSGLATLDSTDCGPDSARDGTCVAGEVRDGAVSLEGQLTRSSDTPIATGVTTRTGTGSQKPSAAKDVCRDPRLTKCYFAKPWSGPDSPTASTGTPGVTISDIATFRPRPGTDHMQPDGWTIAGLDTNFYALAPQQVVPGTLLGRPAGGPAAMAGDVVEVLPLDRA